MIVFFDIDDILYLTRFEIYSLTRLIFKLPDELINRLTVYTDWKNELINIIYESEGFINYRYKNITNLSINKSLAILYGFASTKNVDIKIFCKNEAQIKLAGHWLAPYELDDPIVVIKEEEINNYLLNHKFDVYYCNSPDRIDFIEKSFKGKEIICPKYDCFDINKILSYENNKYEFISLVLGA